MYIVLRQEGLVLENGRNLPKSGCITQYSYRTRIVLDSNAMKTTENARWNLHFSC